MQDAGGKGRRRLKTSALVAAVVVMTLAASGCIAIKSQSASQRVPGVITLSVAVCASDRDRSATDTCDPENPGQNTAESDSGDDATEGQEVQVLAGFRVPVGTTAPDGFFSATLGVFFTKNPSYTAALMAQKPPAAGATWAGYLSTAKVFGVTETVQMHPEFTLPSKANGAPFTGPFLWRAVVGLRAASGSSTVNCAALGTRCFDSPPAARIPINLSRNVSDFGVLTVPTATAGHGQTAAITFPVQYVDAGGKGARNLKIAATTTLPGSVASPSVTTLAMASNTTKTVTVNVPVPPATPLGDYKVTLEASEGTPAVTRSSTATLRVVDRLAPTIRIGAPANGATFQLGQSVPAEYACSDETNGTGLSRCAGPVANGAAIDTSSLGAKTFTVNAADRAGNAAAASTTYTVLPRPAPPVKVSFNFIRTAKSTTFTKLLVKGVPKGSKVTAKCRPKKKGKKCPGKRFTKRNAGGKVKLKSLMRKRFAPGMKIDIRVTRDGSIGAVKIVKIRRNSAPSIATRCLPPGTRKPQKRC